LPYFIGQDDIESFYNGLKKCTETYEEIYEKDLKIAFNKFDKDGSGAIDKDELADLSKELGSELTEE
jgi:Ca2+-binding EF-hand superfamily protein